MRCRNLLHLAAVEHDDVAQAAPGGGDSRSFDVQNVRLYIGGQAHEKVKFTFNTECESCVFGQDPNDPIGAKGDIDILDAIAQSGNAAINYFVAQEYTKAVGKFATSPNAKTILFPVEATQLIGSLGGIGELVREAITPGTSASVDRGTPLPNERGRAAVPRTTRPEGGA